MSLFITNIPAFNEQLGPYHTFFLASFMDKINIEHEHFAGFLSFYH